jgi:ABC-type sugar transport system ATPase subunit
MAAVTLAAVAKAFGATRVVHGVDVHVADGEFAVLVGPSGCGKSYLFDPASGARIR